MASYKELLKEYRKLAKRADQRLVRIEAASHEKQYSGIKEMAYKNAMRDIAVYSGKGAKRFNTKPPESHAALQRKINDIKNFLNMKTSKVSGLREINKKRVEHINKKFNTNFTVSDWKRVNDSGVLDAAKRNYGYTAIEAIANIERDKEALQLAINEAKDREIEISQTDIMEELDYDWIMKDVISVLLKEHGISYLDMH